MKWVRVTETANIPLREGRAVQLGSRSLALFNLGDRYVAIDNVCPHRGGPLADGIVGGTTVTCPLHNWRVCLESGAITKPCEAGVPEVRRYPVKVEQGIILLAFDDAHATA